MGSRGFSGIGPDRQFEYRPDLVVDCQPTAGTAKLVITTMIQKRGRDEGI